jgi:capsular exopolysaccharide synthesis family protein
MRDIDNQSEIAARHRERIAKLSSTMNLSDNTRIRQVTEATLPDGNDAWMKYLLVGFTGCMGMAVAVCGVTFHEFQRRKVNCASEVAEGLGMRVVGALPSLNGRGRAARNGLLHGMLSESIDSVRTTLLHSASADATRVVMVTSAVDQEGKTTVASQLAASLARCGRRTLLIDGDVRHPTAHELFDTPLDPGFCEVLRGEADVEDAIRPTRAPGLWVMSAGRCDVDAIQALAKDAVGGVFESIRPDFDFIVVDSAPVLTLSDSLSLGQHVDAAIISVLRDVSQTPKVYQASELLKSVGVSVLGAVVNGEVCATHRRMNALPSPN